MSLSNRRRLHATFLDANPNLVEREQPGATIRPDFAQSGQSDRHQPPSSATDFVISGEAYLPL